MKSIFLYYFVVLEGTTNRTCLFNMFYIVNEMPLFYVIHEAIISPFQLDWNSCKVIPNWKRERLAISLIFCNSFLELNNHANNKGMQDVNNN